MYVPLECSIAQHIARTGALVNAYVGNAGDVGVAFSKDQYMNGMSNAAKTATNRVLEGVQQVNKLNITGEDGLRIVPTIERAKLLSANNTVLRDENGFIIRPLSDFIEASPQATIRATSNLVKDNPIIMSPVRFAGDVVSLFRADGVNPATGEVATNLNKPYAKLGLAIDAAATFSPLVELRGMIGASKLSPSIEAIYQARYTSAYESGLTYVDGEIAAGLAGEESLHGRGGT